MSTVARADIGFWYTKPFQTIHISPQNADARTCLLIWFHWRLEKLRGIPICKPLPKERVDDALTSRGGESPRRSLPIQKIQHSWRFTMNAILAAKCFWAVLDATLL